MNVSDIMVPNPVHLPPQASLNRMMDLMDRHGFRHLPIVEGEKLVGIVSQRDLLSATGWLPLPPDSPICAADVLHRSVATVSPEDSLVTLMIELDLREIGCMPVLDGNKLVGIVTETDLLAAALKFLQEDPPVREVMSPAPESIQVSCNLGEAEQLAQRAKVRHVPVVSDGKLVGMLSDRDFRRSHGRGQATSIPVERVMTAVPIVVDESARVSEAADHLVTHRISALPVMSQERVVGIVSIADVLEHCENHLREAESS